MGAEQASEGPPKASTEAWVVAPNAEPEAPDRLAELPGSGMRDETFPQARATALADLNVAARDVPQDVVPELDEYSESRPSADCLAAEDASAVPEEPAFRLQSLHSSA
jgi:hypothetical protein